MSSDYNYVEYRLAKSKETLDEVQTHIKNKFWNTAVNRMYYACFYAVSALLIKDGIEVSSHSGVRLKFGQLYVKTGKIDKELAKHYTNLYDKRLRGDYNDFFEFTEDDVKVLYPASELLITIISNMINSEN